MPVSNSEQKESFKLHCRKKTLVKNFTFGQFLGSSDFGRAFCWDWEGAKCFRTSSVFERDATILENHSVRRFDAAIRWLGG